MNTSFKIKSYKQSIIQLLQEILQLQKDNKNLSMKQYNNKVSIVQNAMQSIGVAGATMKSPSLRDQSMIVSQTTCPCAFIITI